jgi:PhnB protein
VKTPPAGYNTVTPYLLYEDAVAAVEFLSKTFGFTQRLAQLGAAGRMHYELILGEDGVVMLGQAGESFRSPRSLGAYPPVLVHFYIADVESLHRRARAAGADVSDLETSPVGDRRFTATDPEGQVWVFAQRMALGEAPPAGQGGE